MKNSLKQKKGITLIALVITIIVLLILAGVTVVTLTGDNGILTKVADSKNENIIATEKEKIGLGYNEYRMKKYTDTNPELTVEGATVTENGTAGWTIKFAEHKYTLSADGKTITGPISSEEHTSQISIISTTISSDSLEIEVGETETLTLTINPNNATEVPVWTSSDEEIAIVTPSSDGKTVTIEALEEGTVTISATKSTNVCTVEISDSYETCCFDAGSQVLMADGNTKNIEDVKTNDMVMSLNENTGEYVSQKVKNTIIKHNSDDLVYINLSNGKRIGMRAYHPLLTTEGYKSLRPKHAQTTMEVGEHVGLLKVGDTLVGYDENATIISIEKRPEIENYDTYNLSIDGYNNYIVNSIVVHNAGAPTDVPTHPGGCN